MPGFLIIDSSVFGLTPKISAARSLPLAGPIFHLYRKAKRVIQGEKCEVFYNGSVRQPAR
jgi:hypothetical protein